MIEKLKFKISVKNSKVYSFAIYKMIGAKFKKTTTREVFAKLHPEQVVFVLSVDQKGKPSGMVAGWSMKCSSDPPIYAVCIYHKWNTCKLIDKSKEFVVAVPNKKLEKAIYVFGAKHGDVVDKFEFPTKNSES